jgi:hypothetical protein
MPYGPIPAPAYFIVLKEKTTNQIEVISHRDETLLKEALATKTNHDILLSFVGRQLRLEKKVDVVLSDIP